MNGWTWRKASGGWLLHTDHNSGTPRFHAYDTTNHAACEPLFGLDASCEEPNEGSDFCPACMAVVRSEVASR